MPVEAAVVEEETEEAAVEVAVVTMKTRIPHLQTDLDLPDEEDDAQIRS